MAWCLATYEAAYGGKAYPERRSDDLQRYATFSITGVSANENNSNTFMIGRVAIPVNNDIAASSNPVWLSTVEHSEQVSLPAGYTV